MHPLVLSLVIAAHVALIAAAFTHRFTLGEDRRLAVVQTFDLTPPPPPAEPEAPPPEPSVIHVPPPRLVLPQPAPPVPVTMTPDPPPEAAPVVRVELAPAPAPLPPPPAPAPVTGGELSSTMIEGAPPTYPIESRRRREQGTVVLALLLGTDGRVAEIRLSRSSGYARLDDAALRAVRRWRWSPAVREGIPVQVRGTVEIPFVLTG